MISYNPITYLKEKYEGLSKDGKVFPVECQFCDTAYTFTPEDIQDLLAKV